MTTFLEAYAEKEDNKLRVTLRIIKDLNEVNSKVFLLRNDEGGFKGLVDDLYSGDIEKPEYITKKEFKEQFIDYTLKALGHMQSLDADGLNAYYEGIFKLSTAETYDAAGSAAMGIIEKQQKEMKALIAKYQAESDAAVEAYDDMQMEQAESPDNPPADAPKPPSVKQGPKPSTSTDRPVKDLKGQSQHQKEQQKNLPPGIAINKRGIAGDRLDEPVPAVNLYPGDKSLIGENNSGIILGRDERYRLKGHTQAGACYIYAGRSPHDIKVEETDPFKSLGVFDDDDSQKNPGENKALKINNNLIQDSAYLYLSQKADSDNLLKVSKGTYGKVAGSRAGQSLAALKADDVVIMARQSGIRLITATDKKATTTPKGEEVTSKFGIDLIAGNNSDDLQPLIKGDNLVTYLKALSKAVDKLHSVVFTFLTSQIGMNAAMAQHTHYDPFCIYLGLMTNGNPLGFNGGKNLMSPEAMKMGVKTILDGTIQQKSAIMQILSRQGNDANAFEKYGGYRITSAKNRTN
jgi:hypothetical protein